MNQKLQPIELIDYFLWPDGIIQVDPEKVVDFTLKLGTQEKINSLSVTRITPEIEKYNAISEHCITIKKEVDLTKFPPKWNIPDKYFSLNLDEYLFDLSKKIEKDHLYELRLKRLSEEIFTFKKYNLDDILRLIIYIIDRLIETNSVWGVGRGSSCSSYLLYLMGLHEIDCVLFDISLSDFLQP